MSENNSLELTTFDVSEYLDNEEVIAEYLSLALEDTDQDAFYRAVLAVAKARGVANVAQEAGVGRESLYKSLKPGAKTRLETVLKLLGALGLKLRVASS